MKSLLAAVRQLCLVCLLRTVFGIALVHCFSKRGYAELYGAALMTLASDHSTQTFRAVEMC